MIIKKIYWILNGYKIQVLHGAMGDWMYHSARRNIKHSRPSILAKRITFFYFEVVEYTKGNQRNLIGS